MERKVIFNTSSVVNDKYYVNEIKEKQQGFFVNTQWTKDNRFHIRFFKERVKRYKCYLPIDENDGQLYVTSAESTSYKYPNGDTKEKTCLNIPRFRGEIVIREQKLKYTKVMGEKEYEKCRLYQLISDINDGPFRYNSMDFSIRPLYIIGSMFLCIILIFLIMFISGQYIVTREPSGNTPVVSESAIGVTTESVVSGSSINEDDGEPWIPTKEEVDALGKTLDEAYNYPKFTKKKQKINGVTTYWVRGTMPTRYKNTIDFQLPEDCKDYYKYGNSCPVDPDLKNNLKTIDADEIGKTDKNMYKATIYYVPGNGIAGSFSGSTTCEVFNKTSNIPGNHIVVWDASGNDIIGVYEYIYPEMSNDDDFTVSIGSSIAGEDWNAKYNKMSGYIQFVDLPRLHK